MNQKPCIKAIIGLGNVGNTYKKTRHNIGFMVIDALADEHGAVWSKKDLVEQAAIELNGRSVLLIKPQTYMNSSGKVVPALAKKGIKPEEILIVHDELEKSFGTVVTRFGGSHKGHNGLRSLIEHMGSDFWRLRIGIGRPDDKADVPDYVLRNFSESADQVAQIIAQSLALITKEFC